MGIVVAQFRGAGQNPIDQFIQELGTVTKRAQLSSMRTAKQHRVVFDFNQRSIYAQQAQRQKDTQEVTFESMPDHEQIRMDIPDVLMISAFYVDGTDELAGGVTDRLWMYVYPSGILQSARIGVQNTNTDAQEVLTVNPFTAIVDVDETA